MKYVHIQAIVMVFVVLMPLAVSTVYVFNNEKKHQECCENTSNEEQNEERDVEEDVRPMEAFIYEDLTSLSADHCLQTSNTIKTSNTLDSYKDILTPPPKV